MHKDQHLAQVQAELVAEVVAREVAGKEDTGVVKGDMHITELIAMGLQLEDQQRVLAFNIAATGLHPTDGQHCAMIEHTSKHKGPAEVLPMLANIRECEDEERAHAAEGQSIPGLRMSDLPLWLPSVVATMPESDVEGVTVTKAVQEHEYQLHANMHSGDKIAALNEHVQWAVVQYPGARTVLEALGRVLNKKEWEWTLPGGRWEDWWKVKVDWRGRPEGLQCEGETAYTLRQADIQAALAEDFAKEWVGLPGLISNRRVDRGVDGAVDSNKEASDEYDMGSGKEDKPIPSLPQQMAKLTYVDEVLVM
ncbi:hypothetical protein DFH08DRAFT_826960 [Mycena albidolilacea]|uniref:Uncharacterized protein n=1 Tax=Mycena albidolilacea TaxID=1033008 RepID=A0AAD6YZC4_9AGAR|nr:hypothetical protein DFH08DRAFT_826960 [Mycena albidolilacea]